MNMMNGHANVGAEGASTTTTHSFMSIACRSFEWSVTDEAIARFASTEVVEWGSWMGCKVVVSWQLLSEKMYTEYNQGGAWGGGDMKKNASKRTAQEDEFEVSVQSQRRAFSRSHYSHRVTTSGQVQGVHQEDESKKKKLLRFTL